MNRSSSQSLIEQFRESIERLPDAASLPARQRKILEAQLRSVIDELGERIADLDPISQPVAIFDPSNPKVVGRFVSLALVAQDRCSLNDVPKTYGSGVYAIYYKGEFEPYDIISGSETPIYVGQAAPSIRNARSAREQGAKLSSRLNEHRKNIAKAHSTLNLEDFEYRSLVIQSGWETAAEDYLIHLFKPIWNSETNILYGLGKHGDSAETRQNSRSPWDTMHPGRAWAAKSANDAKRPEVISEELIAHFARYPAFASVDEVLASFLDELKQI